MTVQLLISTALLSSTNVTVLQHFLVPEQQMCTSTLQARKKSINMFHSKEAIGYFNCAINLKILHLSSPGIQYNWQ